MKPINAPSINVMPCTQDDVFSSHKLCKQLEYLVVMLRKGNQTFDWNPKCEKLQSETNTYYQIPVKRKVHVVAHSDTAGIAQSLERVWLTLILLLGH